jgi:hypothetical protein
MPFSFDLRFMVADQALTFYLDDNEIAFDLVDKDGKEWRNALRRSLSQVGFHEQFKPLKKIGKGNFATVYMV